MKYLVFTFFIALSVISSFSSCNKDTESCTETVWYQDADADGLGNPAVSQDACDQPTGYVSNNSDTDDTVSSGVTLHAAFAEFDEGNTDIYLDGADVVIETNGLPNHSSVYWGEGHALYQDEPDVALTPSTIPNYDASASLTVSTNPQLASSSTSTQLGAIGIAVSGAAIFNDSEGNGPLSDAIVSLDYAGAHIGPSEYHYHLEPIPFSSDDDNLVGIMADGFFIYGRKCNSTNDYPTDLDASGGHHSTTQHNSDGEYHYHIINEFYTGSYILLFGGDYQGTPSDIN
ncbi:MAG: YHYH protein [Saprospiraceae bacterium]